MKVLYSISILLQGFFFYACSHKTDVETDKVEVKEVVIQQVVEDVPMPPPHLTSNLKTLSEWLFKLCDTENPNESIVAYNFGIFESQNDYTIVLTGSKQYDKVRNTVTIDFEPSIMYYALPEKEFGNLKPEEVQNSITNQLKDFMETAKFKHSFFAKAKAIVTAYNGENLVEAK